MPSPSVPGYALAGVIAPCLLVLVMPVGPAVLDTLVTLNIVATFLILICAARAERPLELCAFPRLLLVTTLARLAITVAATRLILSRGEAGDIIEALGASMTGGETFAGIVVFAVILLAQFLVIAKGSERVAEVVARFTLDALPGRQMSIDADLRAGLVTAGEAAKARAELNRESRFYGAMDGALKFIKGETIATAAATLIAVLGGIVAGVWVKNLAVGEAARVYARLAIGEGLAAQLPSLMLALAAGLLVTRVPPAGGDGKISPRTGRFGSTTKLLACVAVVLVAVGLVSGLPKTPLAVTAGMLLTAAFVQARKIRAIRKQETALSTPPAESRLPAHALPSPLTLAVGERMHLEMSRDPRWRRFFHGQLPELIARLGERRGLRLPLPRLVTENLPPRRYELRVFGTAVAEGFLSPDDVLVPVAEDAPRCDEERRDRTVHGTAVALVARDRAPRELRAELPEVRLARHIIRTLELHAADFAGIQEVRERLSETEKLYPDLVREVVPRLIPASRLADVVKRLVEERIPANDFRAILETIAVARPEERDNVALTEEIRRGLGRAITRRFAGPDGRLRALLLDPALEGEISAHVKMSEGECFLTLEPSRLREIASAVTATVAAHRGEGTIVLLTDVKLRRYVRKIIAAELPELPVLSYQELDPNTVIDRRDTVGTVAGTECA